MKNGINRKLIILVICIAVVLLIAIVIMWAKINASTEKTRLVGASETQITMPSAVEDVQNIEAVGKNSLLWYGNSKLGIAFDYPRAWGKVELFESLSEKDDGQNDYVISFVDQKNIYINLNQFSENKKIYQQCSLGNCEKIEMKQEITSIGDYGKRFKRNKSVPPYVSGYFEKIEPQYTSDFRTLVFYVISPRKDFCRAEIVEKFTKGGKTDPRVIDVAESFDSYTL